MAIAHQPDDTYEPEAAELPDTKPEGMREGMPDVGA